MIVYRTENLINGKFYYGVHHGKKNSYLGGGTAIKKAINKYGRENFVRRTIKKFETPEEAYAFERLLVDEILVNDRNCYNTALGGGSITKGHKFSDETKKRMSLSAFSRQTINRKTKCNWDGIEFDSIADAARHLGVKYSTMQRRIYDRSK